MSRKPAGVEFEAPPSTAAVRLEQAMTAMLERFEAEHGPLVREACSVPEGVLSLRSVVMASVFGHTLVATCLEHGRLHTERIMAVILDQLDRLPKQTLRPPSEAMH